MNKASITPAQTVLPGGRSEPSVPPGAAGLGAVDASRIEAVRQAEAQLQSVLAQQPAVEVAEELNRPAALEVTLSTGVRARLKAVSPSLMDMVANKIKTPKPPLWHDPDKDRDVPNPADPDYIVALADANRRKAMSFIEAMVMFGVELLDPVPPDDDWLPQLRLLAELQGEEFSYDVSTPLKREFVYKLLVAVAAPDIELLNEVSGLGGRQVEEAVASFRR